MGSEQRREIERAYDTLVEHAARYWSAEEENSRRRAARVNLLLTVGIAVTGLGLYRFGTDPLMVRTDPTWVAWFFVAPLITGLALFLVSAWYLLHVRVRHGDSGGGGGGDEARSRENPLHEHALDASFLLRLPSRAYVGLRSRTPNAEKDPAAWVKMHSFVRTYEAASRLMERNAREARRVTVGQFTMFAGFVLIVIAFGAYTAFRGFGLVEETYDESTERVRVEAGEPPHR